MHIDTFTGAGLTRLCGVMLVHGVAWRKVYARLYGVVRAVVEIISTDIRIEEYIPPPILSHGGTNTLFATTPSGLIEEERIRENRRAIDFFFFYSNSNEYSVWSEIFSGCICEIGYEKPKNCFIEVQKLSNSTLSRRIQRSRPLSSFNYYSFPAL